MDKIIYLENKNQKDNCFSGQAYKNFLDFAFERTDYFMLVYVNYNNKGFTSEMKYFQKKLLPYKVKNRTNPSWPGTLRRSKSVV